VKRRALLVDDEPRVREVARMHLELAGFEVSEIGDGARALELGRTTRFDVIILDVMLPGLDGLTICRALRTTGPNTLSVILMLSARDAESDKLLGLDSGADDYLTKPVGMRELVARVAALLRAQDRLNQTAARSTRCLRRGEISLDLDKRSGTIRGLPVELTPQEFELLHLLASNPGIVFSRRALVSQIWHGDNAMTDRTVDSAISRVRKKIEMNVRAPRLILTAWGAGYKFADA
jgi:DNA-binding response OmpR family regulator